jgi:hypothetical protein
MGSFSILGTKLRARIPLCLGVASSLLVWVVMPVATAAQSKKSPPNSPRKYIFLLPDGFKGWVCVDFAVAGAPPLPREGDALVIRPRAGEVLETSDKADTSALLELRGEAWYETNGERKPLPEGVFLNPGVGRYGPNEPTQRRCAFVGTIDEKEAAGDRAPGFENLSPDTRRIPTDEREALVALYKSTDGEHWNHHVGWLGLEGTECDWHGIWCASIGNPPHVTHIQLSNNNLSGVLPADLGALTHLEMLSIHGNHLSGRLPDALIQKWLKGSLSISADPPVLTDVSEVDSESDSVSLLCGRDRLILRWDNTATLYTKSCRNKTPQDRATYCEVKEGRMIGNEFAILAVLLERNGFYSFRKKYFYPATDTFIDSLRVIRGGKTYEVVESAGGSPFGLWIIDGFLVSVQQGVEWEKTSSIPECPLWEKGRVP